MAIKELVKGNVKMVIEYEKVLVNNVAYADGWNVDLGKKLSVTSTISVYNNGKLVDRGYEIATLDPTLHADQIKTGATHRIGNKVALKQETADELLKLYEECKVEGTSQEAIEFEKAETEKAKATEIKKATDILGIAEKITSIGGVIRTAKEQKTWEKQYNDVMNEGGEGYVPHSITTEDVEWAKKILSENKAQKKETSYYKEAFGKLIEAGVPKWYIRLHLLTDLIYFSRVYVYYNPYDIETAHGWYTTSGISIISTQADKNRKCYGEIKSMGFPTYDEYKVLFDGDEYNGSAEYMDAYDSHRAEWLKAREAERHAGYCQ